MIHLKGLALVTPSIACPTDDQEVAGLILESPAAFFCGNEIFSLPSADSRRAVVHFWRKNVHKYWLNA